MYSVSFLRLLGIRQRIGISVILNSLPDSLSTFLILVKAHHVSPEVEQKDCSFPLLRI